MRIIHRRVVGRRGAGPPFDPQARDGITIVHKPCASCVGGEVAGSDSRRVLQEGRGAPPAPQAMLSRSIRTPLPESARFAHRRWSRRRASTGSAAPWQRRNCEGTRAVTRRRSDSAGARAHATTAEGRASSRRLVQAQASSRWLAAAVAFSTNARAVAHCGSPALAAAVVRAELGNKSSPRTTSVTPGARRRHPASW